MFAEKFPALPFPEKLKRVSVSLADRYTFLVYTGI